MLPLRLLLHFDDNPHPLSIGLKPEIKYALNDTLPEHSSTIRSIKAALVTWYGNSVIIIRFFPRVISSKWTLLRTITLPDLFHKHLEGCFDQYPAG